MLSDWQTSIAQADSAEWGTVVAYLIASLMAVRASACARFRRLKRDRIFWWISAVLLVLLGVNKVLDLQALLTSAGREHAKANDWYGDHRRVQYIFVIGLAGTAMIAGIVMLWLTRGTHISIRLALIGLGFIGSFVLVRAASFHHLDDFLGSRVRQLSWNSVLELGGILIAGVGAILYTSKRVSKL